MRKVLEQIEGDIALGIFDYAKYFPNSPLAVRFNANGLPKEMEPEITGTAPPFNTFAEEWYEENLIRWKRSYRTTLKYTLNCYLIPTFGEFTVDRITKGDILKFRASLAKVQHGTKEGLSPDRINHIMTPLRMILDEAADRYNFNTPFVGVKQLKVRKTEVDPFAIDEVNLFLAKVRPDFNNYYTVRFFTGLRTGEIDGLQWQYVDLDKRLILVRETIVEGLVDTTKTVESVRDIPMSSVVYQALKSQYDVTGKADGFVFCNRNGQAYDHRNVTKRIWYTTLKRLGLKKRRPYQTRHTTATLWLASGENPEWIARMLGHANTRMLFTTYSRFVPNLTRTDGSAFERLLMTKLPPSEKE
jgi:integrase